MKRGLFIFIIFLLLISLASANEYTQYESMTLKQTIENDINIIPLKIPVVMEYFDSTLYLVPQNTYRQEVISSAFKPTPYKIEDDKITFREEGYSKNYIGFNIESVIQTQGTRTPITKKIPFPITDIPNDVAKYTEFTESIDSNNDIRQQASNLANGIDDLFELEFFLATWVEDNIQYNLSSVTADANEPSSWVMKERRGVCDEITNLFISFNRELGVPARFVSGVAYTDSDLFDYPWGNHGWAEVYFPDVGWVPFDITYRQLGYVDASHISLRKDVDGSSNSIKYSHKGQQDTYDVNTGSLEFATDVIKTGPFKDKATKTRLYAEEEAIGFGSYDVIYLEIKNTANHYIVEFVQMANTLEIEQEGPLTQFIFLEPYEVKTIPFLIKSSSNLDPYMIYTYPFTAYVEGGPATTKVTVLDRGEIYGKNYMSQFLISEDQKIPVEVYCSSPGQVMINDTIEITCSPFLDAQLPLRVCLDVNCKKIENLNDEVTFTYSAEKIGVRTLTLTQTKKGTSADIYVTFKAIDNAKLSIGNVSIDDTIGFKDQKALTIQVNKESFASAKDAIVRVKHPLFIQEWNFPVFDENKQFEFTLAGSNLGFNENDIVIEIEYTDSYGERQVIEAVETTKLVNLTPVQKAMVATNVVNAKVTKFIARVLGLDENDSTMEVATIISVVSLVIMIIIILKIIISTIKKIALRLSTKEPKYPDYENHDFSKEIEKKKKANKASGTKKELKYQP
ncbi:transglutaminase domain-containing protein [Candidatus Woesearchaeota archaeon]|nr:transglutaminase domain-containing protein [Candidatus Woesearchaeota archaeon]